MAALLKTDSYTALNEIFTSHYLRPQSENYGKDKFESFSCFYGASGTIQEALAPPRQRLYSPTAELIKRQADREDLPLTAVIQAELVVFLMAALSPDIRWYPQTLLYASHSDFPFFVRATQHKHFLRLAVITGIKDADELREAVKAGLERLNVNQWYDFAMSSDSFWNRMNMDKLDSLK